MNIIRAYNTHREAIINLLKSEKLPVDDLPENLEHFFVAMQDSEVVGAIGLEQYSKYGLLRSMVVRQDYRNHKIAAALVDKLEKQALALKIEEMYLLTETAADYFRSKNYHQIDRSEVPDAIKQSTEFSSVCPTTALVMKKILY